MSKKRLSPEAKFRVFVLLVLVIIVGLGGLILYNIKTNPSFWEASVSSCITIIIALVFFVLACSTEKRSPETKRNIGKPAF